MNLIKILETNTEAESLMYKELLERNDIKAHNALSGTETMLRLNWGGATLPNETWGVFVPSNQVEEAKAVMGNILVDQRLKTNYKSKPTIAQSVFKILIIIYLSLFLLYIISAVILGIKGQ